MDIFFIIIILTNGHYTQSVDWCISRVSHNLQPSAPLMAGDTAPFFGTVARKCAPHSEVTPLGGRYKNNNNTTSPVHENPADVRCYRLPL